MIFLYIYVISLVLCLLGIAYLTYVDFYEDATFTTDDLVLPLFISFLPGANTLALVLLIIDVIEYGFYGGK